MKLLKASIQNFLIIHEADVPLDAQNLILVLGYSADGGRADSNGVGKSSLFEAVCWCLYGKTYKGLSHDDVVNNRCKGGTRVEVQLQIGKDDVTVVRHRKHSKYKNKLLLFKNGDNITPFNQKDADIVLQSLLPLSFDAFKHVCYFGQGMADKFLAMNDSGRKQLLEELLGLDVFNAAEKVVKGKLKDLREEELILTGKLDTLQRTIEKDQARLDELNSQRANGLREIAEERAQLVEQLDDLAIEISLAKAESTRVSALKSKLVASYDETVDEQDELERSRQNLVTSISSLQTRKSIAKSTIQKALALKICPTCDQKVAEEVTKKKVDELQAEITKVEDSINRLQNEVNAVNDELDGYAEVMAAIEAKLDQLDVHTPTLELNRLMGLKQRNREITEELKRREAALTAPSQGLVEALREAQEELEEVGEGLDAITQIKPYLQYWEKGFSTTGVRSLLLDDVIVYLNNRINHHSHAISDGEISIQLAPQTKLKSGETREKMSVNATTGGAGYKAASGGQQRRMDLAVHFALSDLTSMVTGHRVNVLICDEVLDCIDETGTDAILSMLEEKTRRGMTVFLIDHTDAVKDNVNQVLLVSKENGVSTTELQ